MDFLSEYVNVGVVEKFRVNFGSSASEEMSSADGEDLPHGIPAMENAVLVHIVRPYVNSINALGFSVSCRSKTSSVILTLYLFSLLIMPFASQVVVLSKKSHDKDKKIHLNKQQKTATKSNYSVAKTTFQLMSILGR